MREFIIEMKTSNPVVLVVDGEKAIVQMIAAALTSSAFFAIPATTADDALRECALCDRPIDVAIIDVQLDEGVSGARIAASLRQYSPETGIIFLAAMPPGDIFSADVRGAVALFQKPFNVGDLLSCVRRLCAEAQPACHVTFS